MSPNYYILFQKIIPLQNKNQYTSNTYLNITNYLCTIIKKQ